MDLQELVKKLKTAEGYMVTVSYVDKNGKIEHTLLTDNFQYLDMLPSHDEIKKLIVGQLEASNEQV